ncbi:MAG: helix-turn-helix domain-containing protein [Trichocoleus desertorum ATA4-8-CV12]|jgi:putative transcriptional regulator|nr:helix-turn-helix domain-containing protein [Trichocoleus desertorum ATA4-8-CV12]
MDLSQNSVRNRPVGLKQPEVGRLIHELRQLTNLTQVQLAEILGVAYATINRWENGHIQPSPLALKQLRGLIDQLSHFSSETLRSGSQHLLKQSFP